MMMIIDVTEPEKPFGVIADELAKIGEEKIGVQIRCQKEEIFDLMYRIKCIESEALNLLHRI